MVRGAMGSLASNRQAKGAEMTWKTCLMAMALAAMFPVAAVQGADTRPFEGFRALVVEPENFWGWDTAVLCALEEKGFDITYGAIPDTPETLDRYALVALTIKRNLIEAEASDLERYVAGGGAVYGSWGGPMGSRAFLREVCKVGATKSQRLKKIVLLDSPLTAGIAAGEVSLPEYVGHTQVGDRGLEIVAVEPVEGGIPVARDTAGNCLGVLSQHGKGRTAVLGFGPEQDKHYADPDLGPAMMDNLLAWLLEEKIRSGRREWSGRISVLLPARAVVREVFLNGRRLSDPAIKRIGSVKTVELDVRGIAEGEGAEVRVTYETLPPGRNVETVIHLPWNTLRSAADSPARLAEYLESLHVTLCQPLLRSGFGHAWYKGMPQDSHDEVLVTQYEGNFLADLIRECHARGIKVVGGIYFDNATPVQNYPEVARIGRQGNPVKDRYGRVQACFNNPKGQEHSLATVQHLLDNYDLDGISLDDNFELDKAQCFCDYCKAGFRKYCEAHGIGYEDPSGASAIAQHWRDYRQEATRELAGKVRRIAAAHGVPAGGWVSASMGSMHLGQVFDFLGGMVYAQPPRAARGPLLVLGECDFICLLWAPHSDPRGMEREARESVHAGCAAVGFWIRGEDGGYEMDPERSEAMRRALGGVEEEWFRFYRENVLSGDGRFAMAGGKVGASELTLKVRNTGRKAARRPEGPLDLSGLEEALRPRRLTQA